jgi:NTP pyrophosphatase (non-canonical NTP hydrolase)
MEFSHLIERAVAVRTQYAQLEQAHYGTSWTNEELALGFVGDVGDLVKLVMAVNGRRNIPDARSKLAHELADCLWSIIVLAHVHQLDLEQAFVQTMNDLEAHLQGGQTEKRGA